MTEKRLELKEWAKKVSAEWKFIPSLKGKQAERNLFILRTLMISKTLGMSTWDMALEWLKETVPNFNRLHPDAIKGKRQVQNAAFDRRLKELEKMRYIRKIGSLYYLTAKGFFMMYIWDPSIVRSMRIEKFNTAFSDVMEQRDADFVCGVARNLSLSPDGENMDQKGWNKIQELFSNDITCKTVTAAWKHALLSWKSNVDEMPVADFVQLIFSKVRKVCEKKGLKI